MKVEPESVRECRDLAANMLDYLRLSASRMGHEPFLCKCALCAAVVAQEKVCRELKEFQRD